MPVSLLPDPWSLAMTDELRRHRLRERALSRQDGSPRTTVAASWLRVAACGLEPGSSPDVPPLAEDEVQRRRSTSELASFVPRLEETLASVVDAGQMVVVA
ncbi:MAG: hypothetical protein JWR42_2735, partial [Marmoricola sp.]|nr:hypothetical protein [Marmoricola sp.]